MNARKIHGYVAGQIQKIQALPEHPNKATLANLRRGIGRAPGDIPALWGAFLQDLPLELQSDRGKASPAEWAIYTALTLYALHRQRAWLRRPQAGGPGEIAGGKQRFPALQRARHSFQRGGTRAPPARHHSASAPGGHPARLRAACRRPVLDAVLRNCPAGAPALGRGLLSHAV